MLDPLYERCCNPFSIESFIENVSNTSDVSSSRKYNPLETLGKDEATPSSFYCLQSVLLAFAPIHVCREIRDREFAFLDLDDTDGCLMAIQGLYPNSMQYSLTKSLDFNAGLDMSRVKMEATSVQGLARICRGENPRGISLAYCSPGKSEEETVNRLVAGTACISDIGTLIIEVEDYTISLFAAIWGFLSGRFGSVILYKPGTLPCKGKSALLVCAQKGGSSSATMGEQVAFLEGYRQGAIAAIGEGLDNLSHFDNGMYISTYIGR